MTRRDGEPPRVKDRMSVRPSIDHRNPFGCHSGRRDRGRCRRAAYAVVAIGFVLVLFATSLSIEFGDDQSTGQPPISSPAEAQRTSSRATQVVPNIIGACDNWICISWSKSSDWLFERYEVYCRGLYDAFYGERVYTTTDIDQTWCWIYSWVDWWGTTHYVGGGDDFYVMVRDVDSWGYADSIGQLVGAWGARPGLTLTSASPSGILVKWSDNFWYSATAENNYFMTWEYSHIYRYTNLNPTPVLVHTASYYTEGGAGWIDASATNPSTTYYYYVEYRWDVVKVSPYGVVGSNYRVSYTDSIYGHEIPEFPILILPAMGMIAVVAVARRVRNH